MADMRILAPSCLFRALERIHTAQGQSRTRDNPVLPNGGESWQAGTARTITWTSQGTVGNLNIDLSTNGGSSWTNIMTGTANDGVHILTVPGTPTLSGGSGSGNPTEAPLTRRMATLL